MTWPAKLAALAEFYSKSFAASRWIAEVRTSGSYAKKIRALAALGTRTSGEVARLMEQVEHLRAAFKIMDDIIDEDTVRDGEPAFWCLHGAEATIEQAAWHIAQARAIAAELGCTTFEERLRQVIAGARLEVEMENPEFPASDRRELWWKVVEKEAAFRRYLAEALGCKPDVVEAAWRDGVAAQMLDDGLSAIHGKDGRAENSDERLGRLTCMRAFGLTPEAAVAEGKQIKSEIAPMLGRKEV